MKNKPEQKLLCVSKNGWKITYDPVFSHAATHLEDTPQLKELVTAVISGMNLNGEEIKTDVNMGRVVGTCDVVEVDETDDIVYAMRKNRKEDGLVPFVKTRKATPCSSVAIHLVPHSDGSYELSSAWVGIFGDDEPFPGSPNANEKSAEYWRRYAFVYGSQEIIPGTETAERPW